MQTPKRISIRPLITTQPVPDDADDPAIWVHPHAPTQSLILGTNKARAPQGAIGVYDLRGRLIQLVRNLDRPNNIDVAYGFRFGNTRIDIAVATERYASRLRIFRIDPLHRRLEDITDIARARVFQESVGESAMPMGIALYKHPHTAEIYAIISRKTGPKESYLHQYRLVPTSNRKVGVEFVRAFGQFSGKKEIEAIAVDQALGYVYCADETVGIRKYPADPDHPHAQKELGFFATQFKGDHEGIALFTPLNAPGWLLCVEQRKNNSLIYAYPRLGHQQEPIAVIETGADKTDGLDACAAFLGHTFPEGVIVAMNSKGRNFLLYSGEHLLRELQ